MSEDFFQDKLRLHRLYLEARSRRDSYFEKLVILDGGTIALVISAVVGPLRGIVVHKYLPITGIACLVVAMLTLLFRNMLASELEFHFAAETANTAVSTNPKMRRRAGRLSHAIHISQNTGAVLSAIGILLLAVEACLILEA